jgi:hypothetical protein
MATGKDRKGKKRRRSKTAPDNPEQSRRFLEAAKNLGAHVDKKTFSDALDKLLKPKRKDGNN